MPIRLLMVVVVPHEAVFKQDGGEYVFVAKDGKAWRRQVQTGIGNELYVEIGDRVKYGEKVILNPPGDLGDGRSPSYPAGWFLVLWVFPGRFGSPPLFPRLPLKYFLTAIRSGLLFSHRP